MPSVIRAIFLAIHAAAIAAVVGMPLTSMPALGSPLPLPLKKVFADLAQRSELGPRHGSNTTLLGRIDYGHDSLPVTSAMHERDIDTSLLNNLNLLNSYSTQINQNAGTINNLASQASSLGGNADFNQQYSSALSTFHDNFLGFQTTLTAIAGDKGLANYNEDVPLETVLKNTVNSVKDTLSNTDALVASIPGLGPILAPIVYDVKCLVDDVMDATEDLTDAIVNACVPLLQALGIQATQTACDAGIDIVGLCIL